MTGLHDISQDRDVKAREFHRERLSAMLDGTLSADETRFLLRRMQHDDELADCWGRWQFYGDALRGHAGRALPADFSQRVGRAIADDCVDDRAVVGAEPTAASAEAHRTLLRRPLFRWGSGAALAASVALAAFIVGRSPLSAPPAQSSPTVAMTQLPGIEPGVPAPALVASPLPSPVPDPVAPVGGESVAPAAVLVASAAAVAADRPRIKSSSRAARIERNSPDSDIAAAPPLREVEAVIAVAPSGEVAPNTPIPSKPWPRALVPGASGDGAVTAGFGDGSDAVHPAFQPRTQQLRFEPPPSIQDAAPPP